MLFMLGNSWKRMLFLSFQSVDTTNQGSFQVLRFGFVINMQRTGLILFNRLWSIQDNWETFRDVKILVIWIKYF